LTRAIVAVAAALLLAAPGCGDSRTGAANVDVTRAFGGDGEVSAAVDPADPKVLLAGSNGDGGDVMRVYPSRDGGLHWASSPAARRRWRSTRESARAGSGSAVTIAAAGSRRPCRDGA